MTDRKILGIEHDDMTDHQIVDLIKKNEVNGCEEAFKIIYREYYFMIENFIIKSYGTKEDAKDIFQDALVVFYKNVKEGKYTIQSKISTYIFSICKNLWYKKIRKSQRETDLDEQASINIADEQNIESNLIYTQQQIMIADLLKQTGEKCLAVLKAYYYERMKMKKIASHLNLASEQEAKNQKLKCMKKLKAIVKNSEFYTQNLKMIDL